MMFLHLIDTSRVIIIENVFYMYTAKWFTCELHKYV